MCVSMNTGVLIFVGVFLVCSATELTNSSKSDEETYKTNVCSGLSICNLTVSPKKGLYRCMCDSKCAVYGDCCPESIYYNSSAEMNRKDEDMMFSCPAQFRFYVRNRCPTAFADNDVRKKCENISLFLDYGDVKMLKPVQEKISRITYSNAYCALCNGATNFESFKLDYNCYEKFSNANVVGKEVLRSILLQAKFSPETEELTSTVNGTEYRCSHTVITPDHLKPHLRYCEPGMVSSCPRTFNDSKIADACRSVTYVVYTSPYIGIGITYKNVYCAYCNGEEGAMLLSCQIWEYVPPPPMVGYSASTLFLIPQNGFCNEENSDLPVC